MNYQGSRGIFLVFNCWKEKVTTANLTKDETHVPVLHPLQLAIEVLPESPLTNK